MNTTARAAENRIRRKDAYFLRPLSRCTPPTSSAIETPASRRRRSISAVRPATVDDLGLRRITPPRSSRLRTSPSARPYLRRSLWGSVNSPRCLSRMIESPTVGRCANPDSQIRGLAEKQGRATGCMPYALEDQVQCLLARRYTPRVPSVSIIPLGRAARAGRRRRGAPARPTHPERRTQSPIFSSRPRTSVSWGS